jgi:trehalose 2-sulfotransferase
MGYVDTPQLSFPDHAYVVCSTQRSGSTYVCQLLASTGIAGVPEEYFEARADTGMPPPPSYFLAGLPRTGVGVRDDPRPVYAPEYADLRLVDGWRAHLERAFRLGTTPNGVFATKLMFSQLTDVEQHAVAVPELSGLKGSELLDRMLGTPSYVWIRRVDKVRQAISLWRALQTGTWRVEHAAEEATSKPQYSFDGIEHLRRRLIADEEGWAGFFAASNLEPLELHYESDVEADPVAAVAAVLAHIGLELPAGWAPDTAMVKQADQLNDAWQDAYDRDAAIRLTR